MQSNEIDGKGQRRTAEHPVQRSPLSGLWTVGIALALSAFFASTMPQPFVLAVFGELLFFGAMGCLLVAVVRRESLKSRRITAWDQAAILALVSLFVGLFVDVESVIAALEQRALAQ